MLLLTISFFSSSTYYEPIQTDRSFSPVITLPKVVTFTSQGPMCFPVPSPDLLALHEICCKIALMSGAAGFLDKYDGDMDHLGSLDPDGTSSGVLHHAILERLGKSVDVGE